MAMRSFWCFISYRHADNRELGRQWATWLHQAIETYEVPADLVGTQNSQGETIPARIFPVFRDEDELPVDADLASPIYRALDASKFLLVICSPRAVESTYVANEIRYFKMLGRSDAVIAAIVDGEPNVSWDQGKQAQGFVPAQECFPEPLRHRVDAEGNLLEDRTEPIAADFRLEDGAQSWTSPEAYRHELLRTGHVAPRDLSALVEAHRKKCELMKLKIIAGLLGVALGTLTQRDKAYQLALAQKRARNLRRWLVAIGVLTLLALGAAVAAAFQWNLATQAKQVAEQQRQVAETQRQMAEKEKDEAQKQQALAEAAQKDADQQRQVADNEKNDAVQQRARAEAGEKQAQLEKDKAVAANKDADDLIHYMQYDLSDLLGKLGQLKLMDGINQKILEYHNKHPEELGDDASMRERAVAFDQEGDLDYAQGHPDMALATYQQAQQIRQALAAKDPGNSLWQRDLFTSLGNIGDMQLETSQASEALKTYQQAFEVMEALSKKEPGNDEWVTDLSVAHEKLAIAFKAVGQMPDALAHCQSAVSLRQGLLQKKPADTTMQNDLAIGLLNLGGIQGIMGQLSDALKSFQDAVALYKTLTVADASNMTWRYQLSEAYGHLGAAYEDQLQVKPALQAYQASLDLLRFLTQRDPANAEWLSSLSVCTTNVGHMQQALGQTDDALKAYRESLAIDQGQAAQAPNDLAVQNCVARDYESIGNLYHLQNKLAEALDNYRQTLAIDQTLVKKDADNVVRQSNLCGSLINEAVVLEALSLNKGENHWQEVLDSYRQVFTIRQHQAQIYPGNSVKQDDFIWSYLGIANTLLEMPHGDVKEARDLLKQGRQLLSAQVQKSPAPNDREKGLAQAFQQLLSTAAP